MRTHRLVRGCAIALCALIACSEAPEREPASSVASAIITDSAGVQLVHNPGPTVDTTAVRLFETLRIGMLEGPEEYRFHNVAGIEVDEWGRLFVSDAGSQSVRLYEPDGEFVRRYGGPGDGPGEFRFIGDPFLWRDTLHVADRRMHRGSVFDTTGSLLEAYIGVLPDASRIELLSGGPDGWFVRRDDYMRNPTDYEVGVETRSTYTIARLDASELAVLRRSPPAVDSLLVQVIEYPGPRWFGVRAREGGEAGLVLGNQPYFEPRPMHAIDGRGFVYVTPGWPYRIDVYDSDGALIRRMTRAHDSIPVTGALVDEAVRRAVAHYDTTPGGAGTGRIYAERANLPRVGFVPVVADLRASADGWLWVRRHDLEPDPVVWNWSRGARARPSQWDVFDPDGVFRWTVRLPPEFTPRHVRADAVFGVVRDELDVQYVVRWELEQVGVDAGSEGRDRR